MAYPATIDSFPDPAPDDPRNAPSLAGGQVLQNTALEAIETYVGVTGSTDAASLTYRITNTSGMLFGSGVPAGGTGENGNLYTNTATGIIYRKAAGSWSAIYTPAAGGGTYVWASPSAAANTAASFAYKGTQFTPSSNLNLVGLQVYMNANLPVSSIVSGALITVSAGTIATITNTSTTFVTPAGGAWAGSERFHLYFASPITLIGGTTYGLVAGYNTTAGGVSATTSFPVFAAPAQEWNTLSPQPGTVSTTVLHIASNAPVVSTAVSTATNQGAFGTGTYAVAPIIAP